LAAAPKEQGADYRLELTLSTGSWLPIETSYISSSAKVVTKFSGFEVNPQMPGNAFQFSPPPGTDAIPF